MEMFITGLLVGVAIGFMWGVWRATQSFIERIINEPEEFKELLAKIDSAVKDEPKKESIEQDYRTEWHQGVCYLYDSKDNFMAQGSSITEAMHNAEKRFPGLKLNFRLNETNKSSQ